MTDELFQVPPVRVPELSAARARVERAQEAYDAACEREGLTGLPMDRNIHDELARARRALAAAEAREMNKR